GGARAAGGGGVGEGGAVRGAIGVVDGGIWVGMAPEQMRRLAEDPKRCKIGSRDLAPAVSQRSTGGATVSASCAVAAASGIRVFATGGGGGGDPLSPAPLLGAPGPLGTSSFPPVARRAGGQA